MMGIGKSSGDGNRYAGMEKRLQMKLWGRPLLDASSGESLHSVQAGVGIALDDGPLQQPGTLYITTKRLIWMIDGGIHGYAVDFLSLSMHAISRDPEAYPAPCIYTQIEADDGYNYGDEDVDEAIGLNNHETGDLSKVQEMRLVPSDASVLESLFQILCDVAIMNPDPEGEPEGEADWFFNEDEVLAGAIGQTNGLKDRDLTNLSELHIDDERFEDADEFEEEDGDT